MCLPVLSFLCHLYVAGQEAKTYRYNRDEDRTTYSVGDDGSLTINYRLPLLEINDFSVDSGNFYRLSLPGHGHASDPGKPELPVLAKLIVLPEGSGYKIKISDVKTARIKPSSGQIRGLLYPSQESEAKNPQSRRPRFRIDREAYSHKGLIQSDTVVLEKLGTMRNNTLANLYLKPARYNPHANTIELITSMKVEINYTGSKGSVSAVLQDPSFSESLSKGTLNYSRDLIPDYTDRPAGMIILTDTAFRKQIQSFVKWKTQEGYRVNVLYRGASYAGNTFPQLKQTISGIYNAASPENPPPDYLLIIGDVNRIPSYGTTGNITDLYYAEFDGNGDYLPEMYFGRIPASDTSEVTSALQKIIQYEKFEFADTNTFYSRALATTGYDPDHSVYMDGQIRYGVTKYLTPENNIHESHFYHYQGTDKDAYLVQAKDSVLKLINKGTSFINYSGHGDASGWLQLNIKTADTSLLSNRSMYPVIISNACRTGEFQTRSSFGPRMVLEKNRGASAFIGCSNDSYWDEDYYWYVGLGNISDNPSYPDKGLGSLDRLFHNHDEYPSDWFYTLGQINYAGNLSVSSGTSPWKKYYWEIYNVIGDPSMIPVIGTPALQNVSLPDTIPNGIKSLSLTAEPFSYVAISHKDTLWDASFAGLSGAVTLDIPGISDDSCLIVITAQNKYPVIKKVRIADIPGQFLNLNQYSINDVTGNNNKKADFRESIYLSVAIGNMGNSDAPGTSATITSTSPYISILNDSAYIGTIPKLSQVTVIDRLQLKISDNIPDMGIASVKLNVHSSKSDRNYMIDFVVHAPKLDVTSFVIDDAQYGNGDHIADPGETFNLVFRINNDGSSDAGGNLSTTGSSGIAIHEPHLDIPVLKQGSTTEIPVRVTLDQGLLAGGYVNIESDLISSPFEINRNFTFRVGRVRESFEARSFAIFPWINRGSIPWITTETNAYEGRISARSGATPDLGSSDLRIKVYYPAADTLKFYCRVSSEITYDYLAFILNGKEIFKKSGETGWTKIAVPVGKGLNIMEWSYKKDRTVYAGSDCAWIDMIDFSTSGSVRYIQKDLEVARIMPFRMNHIGMSYVNVKVINSGRDTLNGFNLAYAVGENAPVRYHFKNVLYPGSDSVEVMFPEKADLSKYGVYNFTTYGYNNNDDYLLNDTLKIVVENTEIKESLIVYPNPFSDHFTVFINTPVPDRVDITLININGKAIYQERKDLITGSNQVTINVKGLAASTYYLYIRGSVIKKTLPLIVQKN
ncbi:MAG TPA: C25 family cysteine peptidase [Bacteroidales bacterium]|nr:C25 family cysteine peptidase [Bacteroidales bacterium]